MRALSPILLLWLISATVTTPDLRAQSCASARDRCGQDGRAAASALNSPTLDRDMLLPARRESSWHGRLLTSLGGAAVGAGLGFFASQVVSGDWDDPKFDRSTWVLAGGTVGLVLGVSLPLPTRGGQGVATPIPDARRVIIGSDEIHDSRVRNALEAVQLLRPHWLVARGQHTFQTSGSTGIQAYVDGVRIGRVSALADILTETISSIRFYDAAAATLRWGAGHLDGAIQVVTVEHRKP